MAKSKTVTVVLKSAVAYKSPDGRLYGFKRGQQEIPEGLASALMRSGQAERVSSRSRSTQSEQSEE